MEDLQKKKKMFMVVTFFDVIQKCGIKLGFSWATKKRVNLQLTSFF